MAVSDLLSYLPPFNPFSGGDKNKILFQESKRASFLLSKEIQVLKSGQLKKMNQAFPLSKYLAVFGGIQNVIQFVAEGIEKERKRAYRYFSEHYYFSYLKTVLEKGFCIFERCFHTKGKKCQVF